MSAPTQPDTAEQEQQPPKYPTLEAWVLGYFTPMFLHRIPTNPRTRWCPDWWDHAEAITRLTHLWHTWEAARWQPETKGSWWLDLDHHLQILISLDGPFRNCRQPEGHRPGKHEPGVTAEASTSPTGWWD